MTDFLFILPWGLLGGCVVGFFFVLTKRKTDNQTSAPELADLRGQLSMLSQTSQQQQQAQVEQMSALSKRLEESLAGMSQRMGPSLQQQTEKTHQNLADLGTVVIEAMRRLPSLPDRSHSFTIFPYRRGAFGEVLEYLCGPSCRPMRGFSGSVV